MRRKSTNKSLDHKIYTSTAKKIRKINIAPRIMRGGIRL